MQPTIGRIVHFHYENTKGNPSSMHHAAAVITEVHNPTCVTLEVMFSPWAPNHETESGRVRTSVILQDTAEPGRCTWPARV